MKSIKLSTSLFLIFIYARLFAVTNDRLDHIKQELIAYRLFNQRCKDHNFVILTFKREYEQEHPYLMPVRLFY